MNSAPAVSARTERPPQDVDSVIGYSKISKEFHFWHAGNIRQFLFIFHMLLHDNLVSKHSDTSMWVLQILGSYFSLQLDPQAAIYLRQQTESHLARFGLAAFATRRSFLNLFRFYWSMNYLKEAKSLAEGMSLRLQTELSDAPDAFLIWKTLAADVECRENGESNAAALYGELAYQYSLYPGASNRSYELLHSALQLFFIGKAKWGEALTQIARADEWLDRVPEALRYATETLVERRVAIMVLKAAVLEARGDTEEAIRAYSDLMTLCAQHLDEDPYIESWHDAADNRIAALTVAKWKENKINKDNITASPTASIAIPVLEEMSPDWMGSPVRVKEEDQNAFRGSSLVSTRRGDETAATSNLPPTSGSIPKPPELVSTKRSAPAELSTRQMPSAHRPKRPVVRGKRGGLPGETHPGTTDCPTKETLPIIAHDAKYLETDRQQCSEKRRVRHQRQRSAAAAAAARTQTMTAKLSAPANNKAPLSDFCRNSEKPRPHATCRVPASSLT
ncbi:hypothetical protein PG994_007066 [Apiospora phragmitis]|uniref:Uncharacterized protein n=1 Tax=Apiospora phragmitis TaxID=2905665 RepID=A0ABR1V323_9PEZI